MEPKKDDQDFLQDTIVKVMKRLDNLETAMNNRFDRLKQVVSDYLSLGSDFAKGSLITALKQV